MKELIRVLIVEPGKAPREEVIRNELEELQAIVGGYIETAPLEEGVVAICDEEGKLKGYRPNRYIPRLQNMLVGTIVVAGVDTEEGEFTDLPEEISRKYRQMWGSTQ